MRRTSLNAGKLKAVHFENIAAEAVKFFANKPYLSGFARHFPR